METVRIAITDWEETGNLVSVVETEDDPTVKWIVVLNPDWTDI